MTTTTVQLQFLLNGKKVTIDNPSPEVLLVDYLRSPTIGLTGSKKPCGQGGCGGCTVILSDWPNGQVRHRAVNSCLRRLCSLQGMAVTTIEGTEGVPSPKAEYLPHRMVGGRGGASVGAQLPQALLDAANPVRLCDQNQHLDVQNNEADISTINPVAHRLAVNNGSQCGYCSVGFVKKLSKPAQVIAERHMEHGS